MRARANPALIGGFVVGAIALAIAAVLLLGSGRFFSDNVELVAFFPGSVNGLSVGAQVKFKGVEIGSVREILIAVDEANNPDFRIPVFFEIDPDKLTSRGLAVKSVDLHDRKALQDMYEGGLRAQLVPESFVTGVLFIELDMHPGTPYELQLGDDSDLREVPTLPTALEKATSAATQILAKLDEIDIDGLVVALNTTVDEVNKLISSPELKNAAANLDKALASADEAAESVRDLANSARGNLDRVTRSVRQTLDGSTKTIDRLDTTLAEMRTTLDAVSGLIEPESPVVHQIGETLRAVNDAARSVRRLADSLERNPSTVLFGRSEEVAP